MPPRVERLNDGIDGMGIQRPKGCIDRTYSPDAVSAQEQIFRAIVRSLSLIVAFVITGHSNATTSQRGESDASPVRFEAASVKPSLSNGAPLRFLVTTPSGLRMWSRTPMQMIQWAYDMPARDIVGLSGWALNRSFDVEARVSGGPATTTQLRLMLRSLLADRFSLDAHYERRVRPIYALTISRRDGTLGRAMRASTGSCIRLPPEGVVPSAEGRSLPSSEYCGVAIATAKEVVTFLSGARATTTDIARRLSPYLDRPVIDRTGLTSEFDFFVLVVPPGPSSSPPTGGEIFTALREELGLKLEPDRGEVEVLVVRGISPPTED